MKSEKGIDHSLKRWTELKELVYLSLLREEIYH